MPYTVTDITADYEDKSYKIGNGGYNMGLNWASDGTLLRWGDTYGVGVWRPGDTGWDQINSYERLITQANWDFMTENYGYSGSWGACVADSNTDIIYMGVGRYVAKSSDGGLTWDFLSGFGPFSQRNNDAPAKFYHQKLEVDPSNPDVVYAATVKGEATSDGQVYRSIDGGTVWTAISTASIPKPTTATHSLCVLFDPSGGTTTVSSQTRTANIYVSSFGNGVYVSTDGGVTWALNSGSGTKPTGVRSMAISPAGVLYVIDDADANGSAETFRRLQGGAWTANTPSGINEIVSIAADPHNEGRVLLCNTASFLVQSQDHGATWGGITSSFSHDGNQIPWLEEAYANYDYMSGGRAIFHPVTEDEVWVSEGFTIWATAYPTTAGVGSQHFVNQGHGELEQLVPYRHIHGGPGMPMLTGSHDQDVHIKFTWEYDDYATRRAMGPYTALDAPYDNPTFVDAIQHASSVAACGQFPHFVVAAIGNFDTLDCYSNNGGLTWSFFPNPPYDHFEASTESPPFGEIAINSGDPSNIVRLASESKAIGTGALLRVTTDKGLTWDSPTLPGVTVATDAGFFNKAYFGSVRSLFADPNNADHFYVWGVGIGLFKSEDKGATWSVISTHNFQFVSSIYDRKMRMVPGLDGTILACYHTSDYVWRSTDHGENWTQLSDMRNVIDFGFGKAAEGSDYPTIYCIGEINASGTGWAFGYYRSTDNMATWSKISGWPGWACMLPFNLGEDWDNYGFLPYAYGGGSGYRYLKPTATSMPAARTAITLTSGTAATRTIRLRGI
jgi:hypothetical protein